MNRRGFLQSLGAFAAAAFIPSVGEAIIRAPSWARTVIVYRTAAPLTAGYYTFTAYAGDFGTYIGGFKANGGEHLFEIPGVSHPMENPRIKLGCIYASAPTEDHPTDIYDARTRDNLLRGQAVTVKT